MTKSNTTLTFMVIGAIIAIFAVIGLPPVILSLYFSWPFYVYEMVQAFWGAIVLASFYGFIGVFK